MICHKKTLSLCLSVLLCSLFFLSSPVSAAVPGSSSVQAYVGYQSGNTWGDESIQTTPVSSEGQMLIYPTNMQKGAIFRFLFYPNLTAQTGVKGVILKDVDLSFRIPDPYADSTVPDHNLCTAPHIMVGGITGWAGTVSNCSYYQAWANDTQYTHYHFDVVIQGNNSISITSSNLSPIYITVGTRVYNEDGYNPIYERALLASTSPVYFNAITYGSIQYATSATDALLQEMISHQDSTTGAIEDLEQTTIDNTDRVVDAIDQIDQDNADATAQAQTDASADASSSQTQVQGATTSLLSVLGQFVTAVTSASATNCTLNGDLIPHVSLGTLDLCSNSPPQAITALGSLILIAFIIPLAYNTVKTIINLIGEFQR